MTYQSNPKSSGFRELTPAELFVVSGGGDEEVGEIIVTGNRPSNFTSISADSLSSLGIFGFSNTGYFSLGTWAADGGGGGGGIQFIDYDDDGNFDEIVLNIDRTSSSSSDGSFYGGFWLAFIVGGLVSGGGGQSNTAAGIGDGGGFEIGYSSDSEYARVLGDNTDFRWGITPTFDLDPFTIGIDVNIGAFLPLAERHNQNWGTETP